MPLHSFTPRVRPLRRARSCDSGTTALQPAGCWRAEALHLLIVCSICQGHTRHHPTASTKHTLKATQLLPSILSRLSLGAGLCAGRVWTEQEGSSLMHGRHALYSTPGREDKMDAELGPVEGLKEPACAVRECESGFGSMSGCCACDITPTLGDA